MPARRPKEKGKGKKETQTIGRLANGRKVVRNASRKSKKRITLRQIMKKPCIGDLMSFLWRPSNGVDSASAFCVCLFCNIPIDGFGRLFRLFVSGLSSIPLFVYCPDIANLAFLSIFLLFLPLIVSPFSKRCKRRFRSFAFACDACIVSLSYR